MLFWETTDHLSAVIGIISFIPILWSWIILRRQSRYQEKILESIKRNPGNRPIALAISIGNVDIANQVRAYLENQGLQMEIEPLFLPALSQDKIKVFVDQLRNVRAKLIQKGVDKIHLFYMGPVTAALLVGDVFSNGSVQIYYHDRAGSYECWGPLTHPFTYR